MAAVACLSSLLLLWFLLDSWQYASVFQTFGLGGVSYGQVTTAIYLKVSVSDFLTLFSARTGGNWFFSTAPSPILLCAAGVALGASSIIAVVWPSSYPDGIYALGLGLEQPYVLALYIWIYCIVWWFIQDAIKVLLFKMIVKYNIFSYNATGQLVLPESTLKYIADNREKDMEAGSKPGGHH